MRWRAVGVKEKAGAPTKVAYQRSSARRLASRACEQEQRETYCADPGQEKKRSDTPGRIRDVAGERRAYRRADAVGDANDPVMQLGVGQAELALAGLAGQERDGDWDLIGREPAKAAC